MIQSISGTKLKLIRIFTGRGQSGFLRAGVSATSEIPIVSEIIWLFKRKIFCSEKILLRNKLKQSDHKKIVLIPEWLKERVVSVVLEDEA